MDTRPLPNARWRRWAIAGALALIALTVPLCFFVVHTDEYAIVTEFGDPVAVLTSPGVRVKWPYRSVTRFNRRLNVLDSGLNEFLTVEKTPVLASGAMYWRIAQPKKFLQTVFDRVGAESRLADILFAELGAAIGQAHLDAFVSTDASRYQAESILETVAANCRTIGLRDYGIEVVDVSLLRLDFPERTRASVFDRMKSERRRISMQIRSEGEEEGLKIRAQAEEEKTRILAHAYKAAQKLRGEGEASAARIYAESLSEAPEFYRFVRSTEAFRKAVDDETTLILPVDSELFGLLKDSSHFLDGDESAAIERDQAEGGAGDPETMKKLTQPDCTSNNHLNEERHPCQSQLTN